MEKCEFEEKEFEAPLYNQLTTRNGHVWSPGQVLERQIGIDYALWCSDPRIWSLHGISPPSGILLHQFAPYFPSIKRPLPNFSLNLFIQAKRSQPRTKVSGDFKKYGITSPYWKFDTTAHQQARLDHLAAILGADALVCYAAPAFHRLTQLNAHTVGGSIVENSSFPKSTMLSGHKAWNFSSPGMVGVANAEPQFHEEPPLEGQVRNLITERSNRFEERPATALNSLANILRESGASGTGDGASRSAVFAMRAARIEASYSDAAADFEGAALVRDFLHVSNYAETFNMLWFTLGQSRA